MTIEEIRELLRVFHESGVEEMEVQRGENRLRLRRGGMSREYTTAPVHPASAAQPPAPAQGAAPPKAPEVDSSHVLVKSPIVGTYYDQASPGAPPFVNVGDAVEPGQVLCIIESMKLMNEIEAETAGVVAAKLAENGHPVEYGEALFAIRPR
jgi:acetyl-CoA carboxylase biotin carboxyl carrier protein